VLGALRLSAADPACRGTFRRQTPDPIHGGVTEALFVAHPDTMAESWAPMARFLWHLSSARAFAPGTVLGGREPPDTGGNGWRRVSVAEVPSLAESLSGNSTSSLSSCASAETKK